MTGPVVKHPPVELITSSVKAWLSAAPLHPFLLAAFIVVACFSAVRDQSLPMHVMSSFIGIEVLTLLFFLLGLAVQKEKRAAAISATVALCWCFLFLPYYSLWKFWPGLSHSADWIVLAVYLLLLAAVIAFTSTTGKIPFRKSLFDDARLTRYLNAISVFLLIFNLVPLAAYEIKDDQNRAEMVKTFHQQFNGITLTDKGARPDVYYIILDACASEGVLKAFFETDGSGFSNALRKRGFCIAEESISNYDNTMYSLSSSLNMSYLDPIPKLMGINTEDISINMSMMHDSVVADFFRKVGYKIVDVSSDESESSYWPKADINVGWERPNDMDRQFLMLTPWYLCERYFPIMHDVYASRRLLPVDRADEIKSIPGPKFVFIHQMMPHQPYLFDADGRRLPSDWGLDNFIGTPAIYLGQMKFAQDRTLMLIDKLQAGGAKPIIIVQSDHGPGFPFYERSMSQLASLYFKEHMPIVNAYCFPEKNTDDIARTVSPVNSFRILFNKYFDAKLPLLPDRALANPLLLVAKGYKLRDVTNELQLPERPFKTTPGQSYLSR